VKAGLLEVLACPHDGAPLSQNGGNALACAHGHAFPIEHDIPRVLPSLTGSSQDDQVGTADSFGAKWDAFRDEDRDAAYAFQHQWYLDRYGFADEDDLARFLAGRERILDAGCGLGRDVARYARLSNAEVVGFDLSDAVVRARRDFAGQPRTEFVQGDILNPPFAPESFDFVAADQVIHHTPDCPRAFRTLAGLLRPGGQIAVYVYKRKGMVRELADTYVREKTTAMSFEECWEFSEQISELGRELSRLGGKITLEKGVPLLGIEPGEHDVQRLIYWNFLKCFWNEDLGQEQAVLTNFDWYHPPYASRHTPEEVRGWCTDAALELVHMDVIESGISFRAEKPR
jgi:SAM-dependent methyltransferase/uncharacterized protein YbaR (Trm112 family)